MRWLLTVLTWLLTTAILVPTSFFAVIILAGPHSSMLPNAPGAIYDSFRVLITEVSAADGRPTRM